MLKRWALALVLLALSGCTAGEVIRERNDLGKVIRETNRCAALGAGGCTFDASDGSSDVRGAHVSVEAATLVGSIVDGVVSVLRMMWLPVMPAG